MSIQLHISSTQLQRFRHVPIHLFSALCAPPPDATVHMQPTWVEAMSAASQRPSLNIDRTHRLSVEVRVEVVIGVLPDRPSEWRQISLSGRDWRLSYLDQKRRSLSCGGGGGKSILLYILRPCNDFISSVRISNLRPTLHFLRFSFNPNLI